MDLFGNYRLWSIWTKLLCQRGKKGTTKQELCMPKASKLEAYPPRFLGELTFYLYLAFSSNSHLRLL